MDERRVNCLAMGEVQKLPMSMTLKLRVGRHRITSHVELGTLEVQLTAIMSSLSVLEHCHSQMKNSVQASLLHSTIQELSALRHVVLKFGRRTPLHEEENSGSDCLAEWAGCGEDESAKDMTKSSISEELPPAEPSAPTAESNEANEADEAEEVEKSTGSGRVKSSGKSGLFRAPKLFSVMKGFISKKPSRVDVQAHEEDEEDEVISSDSDEGNQGNQDIMSSVVPLPGTVGRPAPPRHFCRQLNMNSGKSPDLRGR